MGEIDFRGLQEAIDANSIAINRLLAENAKLKSDLAAAREDTRDEIQKGIEGHLCGVCAAQFQIFMRIQEQNYQRARAIRAMGDGG